MRGTAVIPTFASLNGYQLYNPSTNNPYGDSQIRSIVDGYINSSFTQEPMSAKVYGELVAEYGRKLLSDIALIKQITTDQQVIDAGFIDPTTGLPAYQNGAMYPGTVNGSGATNGSIVTINGVQTFVPTPTTLSAQLRDVAHIIRVGKAFPGYNVGLRVACMDHTGGYDTHSAQGKGEASGTQSKLLFEMSHAIHAFFQDLGMFQSDPTKNYAKDVIVLVQTEFGRTVAENFSKGTDHGVGSCWFVVGGGIKGGMYYDVTQSSDSQGYSLATSNLDSGRYLRRTVVYKDILEDIFRNHLGVSATDVSSVIRRKTSDPTEATFKPTGMFT
jgi:hypothetical protein